MQPLILEGGRKVAGAETLECLDGFGNFVARNELVPGIAAHQRSEVIARSGLAGSIKADDAASGIKDCNQCADGVENGRDEVALDGQCRLHALAVACSAVDLADSAVELEPGDDLPRENIQGR